MIIKKFTDSPGFYNALISFWVNAGALIKNKAAINQPNSRVDAPEFFNWAVFGAIIIFTVNNWWLKYEYHNWLTGKLSDFTFCFFFPLYISALLSLMCRAGRQWRVTMGVVITGSVFILVKTVPICSDWLNSAISPFANFIFGQESVNRVDPTDLIALTSLCIAYWIGRDALKQNEP